MPRVTIHDVAREAGVSPATVSKALNHRGRVAEETRRRVADAAGRLGFVAARLRRPPSLPRHLTLGVLTADGYGRFTIPVALGAEDAFGPSRATILLCNARDDPIREEFHLAAMVERGVDGIIVSGKTNDPRPTLSSLVPVPVVYAFQPSEDAGDCSVVSDTHGTAALAVGHLRAIGRTRIAHVTGPAGQSATDERRAGLESALAAVGLRRAGEVVHGPWSERTGWNAAGALIRDGVAFDAVFCGSDQIARGVVAGLRAAGRRIPDDVAVVGVDDWDVMVEGTDPPLTSIDLGLPEIGRRSAHLLAGALLGRALPRGRIVIPPRLVPRGTA